MWVDRSRFLDPTGTGTRPMSTIRVTQCYGVTEQTNKYLLDFQKWSQNLKVVHLYRDYGVEHVRLLPVQENRVIETGGRRKLPVMRLS